MKETGAYYLCVTGSKCTNKQNNILSRKKTAIIFHENVL